MDELITSRQNQAIVRICKLNEKKHREAERLFRFDGVKLYCEAVSAGAEPVYILLRASSRVALEDRIRTLGGKTPENTDARVLLLDDRLFDTVSEEKSPEGIISVTKYIDKFHKIVTIDNNCDSCDKYPCLPDERILLLEDIRDPGNLGTMLRTAAAFGLDRLILCGDCADIYNSKTLRGSMGAVFRLAVDICNDTQSAVGALRRSGRRVLAAALSPDALSLTDVGLSAADCILIGNEGHGLSREAMSACDGCVRIPMQVGCESLNAATAAAVLMWELFKKDN